jgi:hypothetical protein
VQRLHSDESECKEQDGCACGGGEACDFVNWLNHDLSPVFGKIELNE